VPEVHIGELILYDLRVEVVDEGPGIQIEGGRHPVVERRLQEGRFVPNDLHLDAETQVLLITGPNMAGKSTIIRQVGLIALLAQLGSFVPARRARLGVVDRIFTRVGAADNLARGESTFMVEMNEAANILNNATDRSLILMDELGRGTSTFDGLSLAWAIVEYLHDCPSRPRTLFATHYHELTELEGPLPRLKNANVLVRDEGDHVVFLHRLAPGPCDRSYGINVAQMAGMPTGVVGRAVEILARLERGEPQAPAPRRPAEEQLPLFAVAAPESPVLAELRQLDLDRLTPLQALVKLGEWKEGLAKDL
jgi:DNA mismatch repair protein MutS